MQLRRATLSDAPLLAELNACLIRDEGHRNPMSRAELEERLRGWLADDYQARLIAIGDSVAGYALYRQAEDHLELRQFFIQPAYRRQGVGRAAIGLLRQTEGGDQRLRIEVLLGNPAGIAFWRALGFEDYSLTMELGEK